MKSSKDPVQVSWQRVCLIILCVILALVLTVMMVATILVHQFVDSLVGGDNSDLYGTLPSDVLASLASDPDYDPNFTGPSVDHSDVTSATLPSVPVDQLKAEGIINIMLIGEDRRPGQGRQRSDSMILCSFNTKTNTITMISFLRDTYIANIPGYWADKLNAAYAYGGIKTMDQTFAQYFGVHIDAHIAIQFDGFQQVIDMLGGVDIELTEKEANWMNKEWAKVGISLRVTPGMNHLNGEQALAYSRIRKLDMDAMRAGRQRKVLTALINAYKSKPLGEMITLATDILDTQVNGHDMIQTDMTANEVIEYVKTLFPMLATATINNQQIPANGTYQEMNVGNVTATKVCDLEANRKILQMILGN